MTIKDLAGHWTSKYTYHDGLTSKHDLSFTLSDDNWLLCQNTKDKTGSRLTLWLRYDKQNQVLTGTWHEVTSPTGKYKGADFHGVLQLVINDKFDNAEGQWVGFNSKRTKINSGEWSLIKEISTSSVK